MNAQQTRYSDTPKTDDAFYKIARNEWVVDADFARELERENNELTRKLKEAQGCADRLADRLTKTDAALRENINDPVLNAWADRCGIAPDEHRVIHGWPKELAAFRDGWNAALANTQGQTSAPQTNQ